MKYFATFLTTVLFAAAGAEAKPLKVFILAGQSNMEGPANISTFDYIGDDPATAPMLKMMRGADGKPAVCDGAWISYLLPGALFILHLSLCRVTYMFLLEVAHYNLGLPLGAA